MKKTFFILLIIVVSVLGFMAIRLGKSSNSEIKQNTGSIFDSGFLGEKGEQVTLENGEIMINKSNFDDNKARFYNVRMPDGKTIYFFVVKDRNGIYRAAANACQVCFKAHKGFHQEGDEMVCDICGNRYPIEKIATEKGGCNPGPINPNLTVRDGDIIIAKADIEEVSKFF